jgi:hypothetical protein
MSGDDYPWLDRMFQNPVTAFLTNDLPAIVLQPPEHVPDLHRNVNST